MTAARRIVKLAWLAVVLCWLAGCGPTAREKTITTTVASLDVAAHAFTTYDLQKQHDIIQAAKDKATADAGLATWRAEQAKVEVMLAAGYRAAAVAQQLNDDQSLSSMVQAALIVAQELQALKVLP